MSNCILSIIIPCYNSGHFIARTLDMLKQQDLTDCEIVIINDGSTDNTLSVVKAYQVSLPNIKLIDSENKGVSSARNLGLENASGEYVCFLDSDDRYTEGTIENYKKCISAYPQTKFFAYGYMTEVDGIPKKQYVNTKIKGLSFDNQSFSKLVFTKKIPIHICGCLIKKSYLDQSKIRFTLGRKIGEDVEFFLRCILMGADCYYDSRISFVYQLRSDSVMGGYTEYRHSDSLDCQSQLISEFGNKKLYRYYNYWLCYLYVAKLYSYLKQGKKSDEYLEYYCENKKYLLKPKKFSFVLSPISFILWLCPLRLLKKLL